MRVSPALCCLRLPGRVRLPLPRVLVSWRNFLMVALRSEAGVEVRWGRGWCRLCRLKLLLLAFPISSDCTQLIYTSRYLTLSMELTDPKVCSMTSFLV